MSKKILYIGLPCLLAILMAILIFSFAVFSDERLETMSVSIEKIENIIDSRTEDASLTPEIIFDDQLLVCGYADATLFYSMEEGGKNVYNPVVEIRNKGYKMVVCGDITEETVKTNDNPKIVVYNDKTYRCFNLVPTTVPVMKIDYSGSLENDGSDMKMYLFDNRSGVIQRVSTSEGKVRYRGASTLFYPKKNLKLSVSKGIGKEKENNNLSLLGMRKDDDWILYAAYNDQEKVRDVFSERLWYEGCAKDNSWGVTAGMEYKYVELVANGEYQGLYALGFPIDEKQLALSGDYDKEALYKKKAWDSERNLEMTPWGAFSGYECKTDNEAIAKGYTGEFGNWTNKAGDSYFDTGEWELLYKYYYYLAKNAKNTGKLSDVIDMNNAIDIYIYFNVIQGVDNVWGDLIKNEYIAIKGTGKNDDLKALYVPWDMDISWGNKWVDDADLNFTIPYYYTPLDNRVADGGYLEQIILNGDRNLWQDIADKYKKLREGAWSDEKIDEYLSEYEEDIFDSCAYLREMERWPEGTYSDPNSGLANFKEYVKNRLENCDLYYGKQASFDKYGTYLRRALEFTDFDDAFYMIEINDFSVWKNRDFVELAEYIGLEPMWITDDIKYIAGSKENGYEYFDFVPDDHKVVMTKNGNIFVRNDDDGEYYYEDSYTVYLNDIKGYALRLSEREPVVFAFYHGGKRIDTISFLGDYVPVVNADSFKDDKLRKLAEKYMSGN
ncbi:MAG: CotH kinase family protein [Lachnospiraceae bacterium]|nr:CotH kinase family protein [Lachnospiraceae bacterium]